MSLFGQPERFLDRADAGRRLAVSLSAYAGRSDVVVLALPRGGVPVGFEIARRLGAPLDVLIVRKLGAPGQPELAVGAIASGGVRVLNEDVVNALGLSARALAAVETREQAELSRREWLYRGNRPPVEVRERIVILVDDGLATGATMRAAVLALRARNPARIIVAVPTAAADSCAAVGAEADELVCLMRPEPYVAVGAWYEEFHQIGDDEVAEMLMESRAARGPMVQEEPEAPAS